MARTISTRFTIEGKAEYEANIKSINAELKLHKAELAKAQAQYKDNANSMQALEAKCSALEGAQAALNDKYAAQASMLEQAKKAQQDYAQHAEELRQEQEKLKNSSTATAEEQKKLARDLAAAEENTQKAANAVLNYQAQITRTEKDQFELSREVERTKQYLDEARASADGCAASIDQYGKEVQQAGESAEEFAGGAQGSKEAINQLAAALAAAGVARGVKEIAQALKECVDAYGAFEAQMSTVQAISGASGGELEALGAKAREMGATTAFTAEEAGQALEYMAMAGWKTQEMLGGLEGVMNLAAASGESLGAVSDIVTDALTAFGLAASDSAHFADVLAAASSNSNTNVQMMGATFQYAAPVAGALGYSIEDVALAVGLMANAGIKGEKAGTALRGTLTNLSKPSAEVAKYTQELGISLTDSAGQMLPLSELTDELREKFTGLTEAEKAQYAAGIAGKEAMSGLLAIVNAGEADYQKLSAAIEHCTGAAGKMAEVKLDNFEGQVTLLRSAADGLKLAVGEQLTPALGNLAEAGTDAFGWAAEFVEAHPEVVGAVTALTIGLGTLVVGVTAVGTASTVATAAVGALNTAIEANPVGMIAAACVAAVSAIGAFAAIMGSAGDETAEFSQGLRDSKAAYDDLMSSMGQEQADASALAATLQGLLSVEEKSAGQKAAIKILIDQLNEAVPGLKLVYDEEKGALAELTAEELDAALAREQAKEQYEAQSSRLTELYTEQEETARRLEEAERALSEAEQEGGETAEYVGSSYAAAAGVYQDAEAKTAGLQAAVDELTAAYDGNAAQIAELEAATAAYAEGQGAAEKGYERAAAQVEQLRGQMAELQQSYAEAKAAALDSLERQMGLFEEMDGKAKTSVDELIKTLSGQVEYMEDYADNLQAALEMGVDEGLVKSLSDGSQEHAQILDAIVKGSAEDIDNLNAEFARVEKGKETLANIMKEIQGDFERRMDEVDQTLSDAIEEMDHYKEWYKTGQNDIQGLIQGVEDKLDDVDAVYARAGKAGLMAYQRTVEQQSPSKKYAEAGRYDIQGLIKGVQEEMPDLAQVYAQAARTALEAYRTAAEEGLSSLEHLTAAYKGLDSLAGVKGDVGNLQYQLWERTAGKRASEVEKYAKKLETLTAQQDEQAAVVLTAQAAYEAMVEEYGQASLESYQYQKMLLQEKLALQDLADEIERVTAAKRDMEQDAVLKQARFDWEYSGMGRAAAAAQGTGYITPQEASRISGVPLVDVAGMSYSDAYNAIAGRALDNMHRHLPSMLEQPREAEGVERQLASITAAAVNAISDSVSVRDIPPMVVNLTLPDDTVVATHYLNPLMDAARANGTPIENPRR